MYAHRCGIRFCSLAWGSLSTAAGYGWMPCCFVTAPFVPLLPSCFPVSPSVSVGPFCCSAVGCLRHYISPNLSCSVSAQSFPTQTTLFNRSNYPYWPPTPKLPPPVSQLFFSQHMVKQDPNGACLAVFMTRGDLLWLMGFNLSIYNEKTSRLFCFSSKRVPSILCPPLLPTPALLIQCGPALLTHTSGEGQTAITIRVLSEVYAQLRPLGYSRPFWASLGREERREGRRERGIGSAWTIAVMYRYNYALGISLSVQCWGAAPTVHAKLI